MSSTCGKVLCKSASAMLGVMCWGTARPSASAKTSRWVRGRLFLTVRAALQGFGLWTRWPLEAIQMRRLRWGGLRLPSTTRITRIAPNRTGSSVPRFRFRFLTARSLLRLLVLYLLALPLLFSWSDCDCDESVSAVPTRSLALEACSA